MEYLLKDTVLWIYQYEIPELGAVQVAARQLAGGPALYNHSGNIYLTADSIYIEGDINLTIRLSNLRQLYMGYDDLYKALYVKNLGLFWKPLRITFYRDGSGIEQVYLHIQHWILWNSNPKWYHTLISMIS